jgi:GPH family glycoside/pentoside/hexuronide:cation symporter
MAEKEIIIHHSKKNMASYGFAKFLSEFIEMAFTTWAFAYYQSVLKLHPIFVGVGFAIFAIWNAANDPLMGFLTNRPFKFTRKWGRRFPWILIGGIPYVLSYSLIFLPNNTVSSPADSWSLFGWLIFSTCLFDTFNSIFFINYVSLFPDKFRSVKERRTATAIQTPIGIIGIALGFLIPPLIVDDAFPYTFLIQGICLGAIGLGVLAIAIPGCRDDKVRIERYLDKQEYSEKQSFFKSLKTAFKQKSFVIFIISYTLYRFLIISIQASIYYVVTFTMGQPEEIMTYLSASFLIGALFSSPLWALLAHKTNNNKRVMVISSFFLVATTIPLMFFDRWEIILLPIVLWGIGEGGYWTMIAPVLGDVIDESVIRTKKREEGVYNGFLQFFGRLGLLMQAGSFTIVMLLTSFHIDPYSPLAKVGIDLFFALIPGIAMLIGSIIFLKYYKLTPDKVKENQEKIIELEL